ncbi:hypothetical protein JCM10213_002319 [Rhodosporidiobolus nylandii]
MPRASAQAKPAVSSTSTSLTRRSSTRLRGSPAVSSPAVSTTAADDGATPTRKRTRASLAAAAAEDGGSASGSAKKKGKGRAKGKDGIESVFDPPKGETVWGNGLEEVLKQALALVPVMGKRVVYLPSDPTCETYGRTALVAEYIRRQTGVMRNRVQITTHCGIFRKKVESDPSLAAILRGPSYTGEQIASTDWDAVLGPDLFPHTAAPMRAAKEQRKLRHLGLLTSEEEEEEEGGRPARGRRAAKGKGKAKKEESEEEQDESSELSSAEDSSEEEEEEEEDEKPAKRRRTSTSTAVKKVVAPRGRASLPRAASVRGTDDTAAEGEKKPARVRKAWKEPAQGSRRSSRLPAAAVKAEEEDGKDAEPAAAPPAHAAALPTLAAPLTDGAAAIALPPSLPRSEDPAPAVEQPVVEQPDVEQPATETQHPAAGENDTPMEEGYPAPVPSTSSAAHAWDPLETPVFPAPGQVDLSRASGAQSSPLKRAQEDVDAERAGAGGSSPARWLEAAKKKVWGVLGY